MKDTQRITTTSLFIAMGILLPMAFHMTGGPGAGRIFLPMHIPVFLAGFLAGPTVGVTTGIVTPLLSSFLTGMPVLTPTAPMMAIELGVFGLVAGILYRRQGQSLVVSLVAAMLCGRVIYGLVGAFLLPLIGLEQVPVWMPLTTAVTSSWPGLLIQLLLIPPVVRAAENMPVFSSVGTEGSER